LVVIGGIVTIAVADAFSDALGIHIAEEAESTHTARQIWVSTVATFVSKFLFSLTFVIPVIFLTLSTAILVSLVWGFFVLTVLSYLLARAQGNRPWKVIGEHLLIASVVIAITHSVGDWIGKHVLG
jgi:VIT1/CCC1 family predicted Fe2+/Mn2+ transporter